MYKKNYLIITFLIILNSKQLFGCQKTNQLTNKLVLLTLEQIEKLNANKKIQVQLKFAAINDFYQSLNNIEYIIDRPEIRSVLDRYLLLNSDSKVHSNIRKAFKLHNIKSRL